ncbi:hypothetical protein E1B28_011855 [Marasmius oreades]|uniref:Uncharacterized protein n=1 Tax=Marasmius oreades TaxID=181124 RepID=A0A9P7UQE4_9AGAR|nr:uncharacterized protein E1B28_011855 [Marasmius oreades]KAG7090258.1 hypothetical protein E1B28_011855 [Marasmius oreades]
MGFTLGDTKATALGLALKWHWTKAEAVQLRDTAFRKLDERIAEEVLDRELTSSDSGVTVRSSVVSGDVYDFEEIKKALEGIAPTPYVESVEVVRRTNKETWDVREIL